MGSDQDVEDGDPLANWVIENDVRYASWIAAMIVLPPFIVMVVSVLDGGFGVLAHPFMLGSWIVALVMALFALIYRVNYLGHHVDAAYSRHFFANEPGMVASRVLEGIPPGFKPVRESTEEETKDGARTVVKKKLVLARREGAEVVLLLGIDHDHGHVKVDLYTSDRASRATRDAMRAVQDIFATMGTEWPPVDLVEDRTNLERAMNKGRDRAAWETGYSSRGKVSSVLISLLATLFIWTLVAAPLLGWKPENLVPIAGLALVASPFLSMILVVMAESLIVQSRRGVAAEYKRLMPASPWYVATAVQEGLEANDRAFTVSSSVDPVTHLRRERYRLRDVGDNRVFIDVSRWFTADERTLSVVHIRMSRDDLMVGELSAAVSRWIYHRTL